jgi:transposase
MEPDPSVPTIFILPTEWSVAGGELTPTLKLKRSVIQQYIDRARAATERPGDPEALAFVLDSAGWAAWFRGEWTAAREAHERALALIRAIGPCRLTATAHIIAGVWRYWAGAWADGTRCLEEGIASAERSGDLQTLPVAHWILAEMDLLDGRPNAARARLEPLLAPPGLQESVVTGLPSTLLLRTTLAWAHLERGAAAEAAAATSLTIARATALGYRLPLVEAWRIQGMVCTRAGRWDEARRAFADGLALARSLPYPYAEARLLHMNGLLHVQMGEPAPARAQLEAARALFARLGARTNAVQVEQDLAGLSQKQGLIEMRLTDVQWAQIEVLLPPRPRRRGRPRADDRRTLEAILYVRRTGCAWADLPAELGDEATAHRRWQEWQATGLWERIAAIAQAMPPGVKGHERTARTGAYTPPASSPFPSRAR